MNRTTPCGFSRSRAGRPRRTALAAGLMAICAADAALAQAVDRRTLSGQNVEIQNLVGTITIEGGTGSDVVVEVVRRGADASRLSIETARRGDRQALRVVYPERRLVYPELGRSSRSSFSVGSGGWLDEGDSRWNSRDRVEVRSSGAGLEAWADVRVRVPRGKRIEVHLGAGRMVASGIDGTLHLNSASGLVTVASTRGSLHVETGSGGARVSDVNGDVDIEVGSGGSQISNIRGSRLSISSGSGGFTGRGIDVQTLNAETGSGGARLHAVRARTIEVETGSGGTELELLNDPDDVSMETGSGGVTLRLPANLGADLDVRTGSGGIDSDFEVRVNRVTRNALQGTIGDGHGRIRIETGSGRVRLIRNP